MHDIDFLPVPHPTNCLICMPESIIIIPLSNKGPLIVDHVVTHKQSMLSIKQQKRRLMYICINCGMDTIVKYVLILPKGCLDFTSK